MIKICYATLFAVVLVGCSPHDESNIESTVFVVRKIENVDNNTSEIRKWEMDVYPRRVVFSRHWAWYLTPKDSVNYEVSFSDPKEAADTLAKFVEWDEKARQNNVEPFRKKMTNKCTFKFAEGNSMLYYGYANFSRPDVDKFNELLKQLPETKPELAAKIAELEAKIAKEKKEATLFK